MSRIQRTDWRQAIESRILQPTAMDREDSATIEETALPLTVLEGHIVGRTLGDFAIKELMGAGGFGAVYRAEQMTLGREVVVKVLHWESDDDDEAERVQRFLREARLASRLDHPYAAHIYAFGAESDGILWLAMELVRGTPLSDMLKAKGPLPLSQLVPLLEKICEVAHTAHQQGIVHRDIKPSNIMVLSRAGRLLPKLLDFGIARLADGDADPSLAGNEDEPKSSAKGKIGTTTLGGNWKLPELTRRGLYLGSPAYMAPEQWMDAKKTDARTDQYAIGVLTYQALTGRFPFRGKSERALARAHASKPVPKLGDGFPDALDEVLARALAKKQDDRFGDVLELAAAFRVAAGLDIEPDRLPQLEPFVRETAIAEAPQPLADAVAMLEASRTPERGQEAALQVIRVSIRLVGLLAMASHRSASSNGAQHQAVSEALAEIRRRKLTTLEWLELARALVRPFRGKADVHPLPELVIALYGSSPDLLLDELAAMDTAGSASKGSKERAKTSTFSTLLPKLAGLLKSLSFLWEYSVVAQRAGQPERWMGARRVARAAVELQGNPNLADGEVALADRNGELVLSLNPLFQLLAPAPGAQEEIFLFDGPGRYGAKLVAFPVGFERHDSGFWSWYRDNLIGPDRGTGERAGIVNEDERPPYMGLSSFSPDDASNFYGRESEAEACVNRLRVQALLAVVGPSGAGKSSFVQAGVIPALPEGWRAITTRPGPTPLAQLQSRLEREGIQVGNLRQQLEEGTDSLGELLLSVAIDRGEKLLLVVDQFEELLTLCLDPEEQRLYAEGLMRAARYDHIPVRVILTLRDDFLLRAQQLPALRERLGQSLQLLATPPLDDLERILIEPARRAGYEFEDPELPREMVTAVAGESSALALLSFTAFKLWELRDRHFRRLPRRAYETLGGVGGALAQHAEETLGNMPMERQGLVREAFRQLVTADGTRAILTRRELGQMLGDSEQADSALEELIRARLLVTSEGEGGENRVEVVHEALLLSWPRLVRWQREDAEGARLRDQLRAAARQWVERDQPSGLLWRGDALLEYRVWRSRYRGSLTQDEEAFARASVNDETRGRRRRSGALVAAFVALTVGLVVLFHMNQRADDERDRANVEKERAAAFADQSEQRLLDLYFQQGRQALLSGDAMQAFVYLAELRRKGVDTPGLRFLLARASAGVRGELASMDEHGDQIFSVDFGPAGSRVLTSSADKTAKVWNPDTGEVLFTLTGHDGWVWVARFSPDGSRIVTAGWDGQVKVWDAASGKLIWSRNHGGRMRLAEFIADGSKVLSSSSDRSSKIWSADTGQLLTTFALEPEGRMIAAEVSPDGNYLVASSMSGVAQAHDLATGRVTATMSGHKGIVPAIAISPDSQLAVTSSRDRKARLFSTRGGELKRVLYHSAEVNDAAFAPDGSRVVTGSEDRTAKVWDVDTGELLLGLQGHTSGISAVAYSQDGSRIVTAGRDSTMRSWDARTGLPLWTFLGHRDALWGLDLDLAGNRAVTISFDGTARIWDLRLTQHLVELQSPPGQVGEVVSAVFHPRDGRIATAHDDKIVRLWSSRGELVQELTAEHPQNSVSWSPDGAHLVSTGRAAATVWNVETSQPTSKKIADRGEVVNHAAYDPLGERIAIVGDNGMAELRDASTGNLLMALEGHQGKVLFVAFHPVENRVVTAGEDMTARIWDAATGAQLQVLRGHALQVNSVRFNRQGTMLVTAGSDSIAKVWTASGEPVATLEGHSDALSRATFLADGQLVVTAAYDSSVRVWDARSGQQVWSLDSGRIPVRSAAVSPDGSSLLTGFGTTARVWDVSYDNRSLEELQLFAACRVGHALVDGRYERAERDPGACRKLESSTER